jgi:chemotaxis protein methyltransferase CheR
MNVLPVKPEELSAWSRYIQDTCGVFLDPTKAYLIETRLQSLFISTGSHDWMDLLGKVKADLTKSLSIKVVNAVTTNETSFFRDTAPFELLQHKLIPELIDARRQAGLKQVPIRILSAACSTGQEAYSTAMMLKELLGDFSSYDIRILGIDISDQAVAQASYAYFNKMEIERGLTPEKITRHFQLEGDKWKLRDELRSIVTFRRGNLLEPFVGAPIFDIIFCRNVAIYFTEPDKIRLFRNLGASLASDGALIIGSTESLSGFCPEFESKRYLRTVFYNTKK